MPELYDVAAIGNAIVDVIGSASEAFLADNGLTKGAMMLVSPAESAALYGKMNPEIEASGGSAANTIAGLASFGGKAAFMGKVADDDLGKTFARDMRAIGARFENAPLRDGPTTAVSMINVTPDAQRTMCTYLGASVEFTDDDVDQTTVESARIVYLEGYLFDAEAARRAFAKAAALAHGSGRMIALTLSDSFVVERHRAGLLGFIETQVDLLFANEAELLALVETDDFDVAAGEIAGRAKLCAVTRGEKGSVVIRGDERWAVPAEPVEKIVDTTGAGDQYAAGFMFGLARDRTLADCARLGSLAAAEVISHYGPRPQVSLKDLAGAKGLL
jgi:sugar/nucleoside kinase (ribokinase family)